VSRACHPEASRNASEGRARVADEGVSACPLATCCLDLEDVISCTAKGFVYCDIKSNVKSWRIAYIQQCESVHQGKEFFSEPIKVLI